MTGQDIIDSFHIQVDDMTELAPDFELTLANRIYKKICFNKAYEINKKPFSGVQSTAVATVPLPSDFAYVVANHNHSHFTYEALGPVVFVGSAFTPVKIISYSDRRQYRNNAGYAYIDIANSNLVFCAQPLSAQSVEFDYISIPSDLTLGSTPIWPTHFNFEMAIVYGMAVDNEIIQRSDKARNCMADNQLKYNSVIADLDFWNSKLVQF